jgi:AraC family transcriptional regulator of adaptative response / DNA-3-methyladenine glycosylase II
MMNGIAALGPTANRSESNPLANRPGLAYELDPAFCWQAANSRDRRFDGHFFAGIVTTGVYCRSICPVSFGHPTNVRWFRSTEGAEKAGFRPCKRCRPEILPGSSAWFGTMGVVSHAMKLISQGAVDHTGLEQLADRVGIGTRHLRRLFNEHLGTSPLKIARSYRAHTARNLILETNEPFTEIASRTGFKSIRQFNHSVRETFGQSPTRLRLLRTTSQSLEGDAGIVVHLPYRTAFDWSSMIHFLKIRATPGVEAFEDKTYRRTIEIGGRVGAIEVWHEADHARLSLRVIGIGCDSLMQIVQRVRRLFDLETSTVHIAKHLSRDVRLAKILVERPGLRVPGAWCGIELTVRAVLGQKLTAVDPPVLVQRLVKAFGCPVQIPIRGLSHLFPRPEVLAEANFENVGVPPERAETIRSLALAVLNRKLVFSGNGSHDALSRLHAHPGLEKGVASYIAMRIFGDPDALAHTDRGLRQALGSRGRPVSPAELIRIFRPFKPWRAYAAMHFLAAKQKNDGNTR